MDKLNVIVCVDDMHPEDGWGCPEDRQTHLISELNKEYGVQYTLFMPSNHHSKYPVSENKEWVDFWKSKDWVEIGAHGRYHDVFKYTRQQLGECEFLELDYEESKDRIELMLADWAMVDCRPRGFRFPGWRCTPESGRAATEQFDYLALHSEINNRIRFSGGAKIFRGDSSIVDKSSVQIWNHGVVFQSHIAGKTNKNNWTDQNYETFRLILDALRKNYILNFIRYEELL